jgi:hypothetical protein
LDPEKAGPAPAFLLGSSGTLLPAAAIAKRPWLENAMPSNKPLMV